MLNRLDGNRQQILNQAYFFLQEGFGVGNAAQLAVEARHRLNSGMNLVGG
jgi:hypothetical protein